MCISAETGTTNGFFSLLFHASFVLPLEQITIKREKA